MNSTVVKMKEDDDRYNQISERIMNIDENEKTEVTNPTEPMTTQNQGKAIITGFHNETSESEVVQLLKEMITEIGMLIENARIECFAKPITHAFIHFKNDDERNKYVRTANMLRKELRGRKLKIIRLMDAAERFIRKEWDMSNTAFT